MFKKIFLGLILFAAPYFNVDAATLENSCIITVSGSSYDVTTLRNTHSGGDIFNCGTDMTDIFNNQHGYNLRMIAKYKISRTGSDVKAVNYSDDDRDDSVIQEADYIKSTNTKNDFKEREQKRGSDYHFGPIAIISIVLYLVTFFLAKKKIISELNHRKLWNMLLLVSFLGMGLLGIALVIRLEYGFDLLGLLNLDMKFWHVEFGIAMTLIAVFHTLWHIPYFKSYLPKKKVIVNNPENK